MALAKSVPSKWQGLQESKALEDTRSLMTRNAKMDLGYGQRRSCRSMLRIIFSRGGNRVLISRQSLPLTMEEYHTIQTISLLILDA